jgi:hypothetical protein
LFGQLPTQVGDDVLYKKVPLLQVRQCEVTPKQVVQLLVHAVQTRLIATVPFGQDDWFTQEDPDRKRPLIHDLQDRIVLQNSQGGKHA